MAAALVVSTIIHLSQRIVQRSFLDQSIEFRGLYRELLTLIDQVDTSGLPADRIQPCKSAAAIIRRHGGGQFDNELKTVLMRLIDLLAWHSDNVRRDRDVLWRLLRSLVGEDVNLSDLNEQQKNFHLSVLFHEGLIDGEESVKSGYVNGVRVAGLTDRGHKYLLEGGHVRPDLRDAVPSIFISHAAMDTDLIAGLVALIQAGMKFGDHAIRASSIDGNRYRGGTSIPDAVRADVLQAPVFVAVLTPSSIASTWVLFELGARWGSGKPLIPLLASGLSQSELKGPLAVINALCCTQSGQLHQMLDELALSLQVERRSPALYAAQIDTVIRLSRN